MKTVIKSADFAGSFSSLDGLSREGLPEIAIIGRSNAGKSTFINKLTGRKNLAITSSTPGRTQNLVYFRVTASQPRTGQRSMFLVDLPGFGFAKRSKGERKVLHQLIAEFLLKRDEVKIICLLNDSRRDPDEEELGVRDIAAEAGKHLLIVASKIDKLSNSEMAKRLPVLARSYGLEKADLLLSGTGTPSEALWDRILALL